MQVGPQVRTGEGFAASPVALGRGRGEALQDVAHHVRMGGVEGRGEPALRGCRQQRLQAVLAHLFTAHLPRSEEHTSELQSLMRISYAVFCLKQKIKTHT